MMKGIAATSLILAVIGSQVQPDSTTLLQTKKLTQHQRATDGAAASTDCGTARCAPPLPVARPSTTTVTPRVPVVASVAPSVPHVPVVASVEVQGNAEGMCDSNSAVFLSNFTLTKSEKASRWAGVRRRRVNYGLAMDDGYLNYACIIHLNGECVDLRITNGKCADGTDSLFPSRHRDWAGKKFNDKYNGAYRDGIVSVGAEVVGTYNFDFEFTKGSDRVPVVLPYLPLTFFDLDGKDSLPNGESYEVAKTCDAAAMLTYSDPTTQVTHEVDGDGCYVVKGGTNEVAIPENWDVLGDEQKKVAVTFGFNQTSKFSMEYTLNYRHRVFIMQASKNMGCVE